MPRPQNKGLMFVHAIVNGKTTRSMVDTKASHNFVSVGEENRLDLGYVSGDATIKAVNFIAPSIYGTTHGVGFPRIVGR